MECPLAPATAADLADDCQADSVAAGFGAVVVFPVAVVAAGCVAAGGAGMPGTFGVAVMGGAARL
jgi:hypothetical protein